MVIRFNLSNTVVLFMFMVLTLNCRKKEECLKIGYNYTYNKPSVIYQPMADSIPLGTSLILNAGLPIRFFDTIRAENVSITENTIFGPLRITKATGSSIAPTAGAMRDIEFIPIIG